MITGVHISSSRMVITGESGEKTSLPKFQNNQIITAKVLQMLPQGKAQILINGQKIIAQTEIGLTPGEEIQLKVLVEKDAVVLKLIAPVQKMTSQQISSLIRFFSRNDSLPDIAESKIDGVKELLYDMALKSDKPDKTFLPKLLENSGLLWEKKLAQVLLDNKSFSEIKANFNMMQQQDMKGSILKALQVTGSMESDAIKIAASFTETMENFQLLNHQNSDSGRFLLPFPVFNDAGFRFGQLLIDTGDKTGNNKNADRVIHISFLLNMTNIGPLRADFSILKKEISGRFLLTDDETCQYVKSQIPDLTEGLESIEYQVRNIECLIAEKEEIQHSSFIETLVKSFDDNVLHVVI